METTSVIEIPEQHLPAKIISVKVEKDQQIDKNTVICLYEIPKDNPETNKLNSFERNNIEELRSSVLGKIEEVNVTVGQIIDKKNFAVVKVIEPCSHAVQWKGMCSLCGKDCSIDDFAGSDSSRATIRMTHDASELFVSQQEAQRLEKENANRLLEQKKLSLILDLDQTIIHATIDPTIGEWKNDPNNPNYEALKDIHQFVLPDSATVYYIKLRPGVREFLEEMNKYYELHIYTMGTRSYANAIAKIIDPTSEYFGNRILSRDESGSFAIKSIQRLFPCDQSMVVVIDDRADVWCWSENLIKVQPYNFFVGIGDINNTALLQEQDKTMITTEMNEDSEVKDNNSEDKKDTENKETKQENNVNKPPISQNNVAKSTVLVDNDHQLDVVINVLKNIHTSFYSSYDKKEENISVQNIMKTMRHKVLSGKKILFSSVIPLNQDPYTTDIWNLTLLFGGTPYTTVQPDLTHVVAGKNGTTKVNQARKIPGIKIVKPEWLLQSIYNWKLENEEKYLLEPDSNINEDESKIFDFIDNNDMNDMNMSTTNYPSIGGEILTDDEKMISDIMAKPLDLSNLSHEWDDMDMEIDEAIGDSEFGNDNDSLTNDSEIRSDDDNDNIRDPNYSFDNDDDDDDDDDDDNDDHVQNGGKKVKVTNLSKNGDSQFNLEDYENDEDFKKAKTRKRKRSSTRTDESNNSDEDEDESESDSDDDSDDDNDHIKKKQHHDDEKDDDEDDNSESDDDDNDDENSEEEDSSQYVSEGPEDVSQSYSESETNSNVAYYSEDNDEATNDLEAELEAMVENDDESINVSTDNGEEEEEEEEEDENEGEGDDNNDTNNDEESEDVNSDVQTNDDSGIEEVFEEEGSDEESEVRDDDE